jgi:tripartite-type tricarboxylate transporter receptor subunit TctC
MPGKPSAGTPRAIVNKLHDDVVALLVDPDIRSRIAGVGFDVAGTTPEEFRAQVQEEVTRWARVIKAACTTAAPNKP